MDSNAIIAQLNELAPPALKTLRGKAVSFDSESRTLVMEFVAADRFTHSGGIVQGGFVTGMIDAAMANAVYATLQELVVAPTLEIKVSFLEIARAGKLVASGRVVRMGKSIAFMDGELRSTDGQLLATATSTVRVMHPKTVNHGQPA
ncbi:MAG: PaaI family thioesterase [Gammaproteobacteria bacterium]|nr:PaaI family thioesterase [Gammaproteobacteria bacterium]